MNEKRDGENRFIEEMKSITHDNPGLDMDLIREWREIKKVLDKVPPLDTDTEPQKVKTPRLQPIPLRMFR